jgi:glycyl-tRNA synthetase
MVSMDKLVSLCKRRGFIFPSSEIYGGLNGCWDYGPLGVELKRNIKAAWWDDMIRHHDQTLAPPGAPSAFDMVGLDSSIVMNPAVWEASGHIDGFSDPMVDCRETKTRYRADQLVVFRMAPEAGAHDSLGPEDTLFASPGEAGVTPDEDLIAPHRKRIKSLTRKGGEYQLEPVANALLDDDLRARILMPGAGESGTLTAPRAFNLMFKTHVGALEGKSSIAYLRPETAQGIFVNFKNVCDTARVRIPFGIGQIGKAFRNEINPRNFTFRSREFEQMEIEFFCRANDAADWYHYWRDRRFQWYVNLGLSTDKLRLREHDENELAHYAAACADVEYEFPFGISELEGIANRTNFDLRQHMDCSGKDLRYFDDQEPEKELRRYLPYVIEPSAGTDRGALAFLCDAFTEDEVGGELRTVLKLHPRLAPIKAAVFPLVKKDGMPERALTLFRELRMQFNCYYDEKGAIGRRYRRQDEAGTPFCITVDGDTLRDDTVTLRERDSCEQMRLPANEVSAFIRDRVGG